MNEPPVNTEQTRQTIIEELRKVVFLVDVFENNKKTQSQNGIAIDVQGAYIYVLTPGNPEHQFKIRIEAKLEETTLPADVLPSTSPDGTVVLKVAKKHFPGLEGLTPWNISPDLSRKTDTGVLLFGYDTSFIFRMGTNGLTANIIDSDSMKYLDGNTAAIEYFRPGTPVFIFGDSPQFLGLVQKSGVSMEVFPVDRQFFSSKLEFIKKLEEDLKTALKNLLSGSDKRKVYEFIAEILAQEKDRALNIENTIRRNHPQFQRESDLIFSKLKQENGKEEFIELLLEVLKEFPHESEASDTLSDFLTYIAHFDGGSEHANFKKTVMAFLLSAFRSEELNEDVFNYDKEPDAARPTRQYTPSPAITSFQLFADFVEATKQGEGSWWRRGQKGFLEMLSRNDSYLSLYGLLVFYNLHGDKEMDEPVKNILQGVFMKISKHSGRNRLEVLPIDFYLNNVLYRVLNDEALSKKIGEDGNSFLDKNFKSFNPPDEKSKHEFNFYLNMWAAIGSSKLAGEHYFPNNHRYFA
jgi:hypothetical protein